MEWNQILAVLGFMFCRWQMCQTNIFLQWAQHERKMRQQTMQKVSFHARRMKRLRMRRRASNFMVVMIMSTLYRRQQRTIWVQPRPSTWWETVSSSWDEVDWKKNFRMTKTSFLCLCDILRPCLTRQHTNFRSPLPVELRVAICLWRLATNLEYRAISRLFGIGISTACCVTQQVVTAINVVMKPLYIKTPSEAELMVIVQGFRDRWALPQVAGAIDGTHISIMAPDENPVDYYNRKNVYSVILQVVVDNKMKFWDINVGCPGKVSDARVLVNSSLYSRGENGTLFPRWIETLNNVDIPIHILGDAAYPLLPWLMKPFPEGNGLTQPQVNFNYRLSQARMTIERAFGRLRGRWTCLLKRCDAHISFVSHIISACCVLHNYCETANEEWVDEEPADNDDFVDSEIDHPANNGEQIRDALCAYLAQL
ncbi:hypothetical protein CCH79_00001919 [Gambusia affinis]|uniref:DDE Tnp4 domain-containing protein n=1 Tax=Gambusia affinis TaxID=33528 RepID=A0A315VJH2_GAMAF|nr:hypothetical protein CCH79_00001919 [Gambusia affinis]